MRALRHGAGQGLLVFALASVFACNGSDKPSGPAALDVSASSLDFGTVPLGVPEERTVTLSNTGGETLEVFSVSLDSGDEDVWDWVRTPEGNQIAPGASQTLTVTFSPDGEGEETGRLQIRSSDEDNSPFFIDLTAEGAPSTLDNDGDGQSPADGDCNDGDPTIYSGAPELCDGRDNDCNGSTPSNEADDDGDGYRLCDDDCDDGDGNVYPGAPEICDDKDSDCDGTNADRADSDGDGYSVCDDDCDDTESASYPGNTEICDDVDNDCDGSVDNVDADGDGHSLCSEAGDCDDNNATAYPVVVDASYSGTESGTDDEPFSTLDAAFAALDSTCRTVWMFDGDYTEVAIAVPGVVTVVGQSQDGVVIVPTAGSPAFTLSTGDVLELDTLTIRDADTTGDGGAIRATDSDVGLVDVTLDGNASTGDGGAIAVTSGDLLMVRTTLRNNTADDDGGAVAVLSGTLTDSGGTWRDNAAARGGALLLQSSASTIDGALFQGNVASDAGGAIAVVGGTGVGLYRSRIWSNTAASGGGGLAIVDVASGTVRNNRFQNNDGGTEGGGVHISGSATTLDFHNNSLTRNVASGAGGAFYAGATDQSGLSVIANAFGWSDGTSGLFATASAGATITYNTGYATSSGLDFDGAAADGTDNNISENPVFTSFTDNSDPTDDDLTPGSSSPLIDSGPPDSAFDDGDGSQNDRGFTGGPGA